MAGTLEGGIAIRTRNPRAPKPDEKMRYDRNRNEQPHPLEIVLVELLRFAFRHACQRNLIWTGHKKEDKKKFMKVLKWPYQLREIRFRP